MFQTAATLASQLSYTWQGEACTPADPSRISTRESNSLISTDFLPSLCSAAFLMIFELVIFSLSDFFLDLINFILNHLLIDEFYFISFSLSRTPLLFFKKKNKLSMNP